MEYAIPIFSGLLGAFLGYLITYTREKAKNQALKEDISEITSKTEEIIASFRLEHEKSNEVNKERRAAYQIFVNMVIDILNDIDNKKSTAQHLKKLHEFYKKNILFASPEVALAFGDYMQFIYQVSDETLQASPIEQFKKLTKVMKLMRTDLGLSNEGLGDNGEKLVRGIIRDFDKLNI